MFSSAREIAFACLMRWQKSGADPHDLLEPMLEDIDFAAERSLARELFMGVIRWKRFLDHYIDSFSHSRSISNKLRTLLRLGFYQILKTERIPRHAAVFETVKLAKSQVGTRYSGFVNAVLRAYLRRPDKVKFPQPDKNPVKFLGLTYSYPDWLVRRYLDRYGFDGCRKLLEFNNQPALTCFFENRMIQENNLNIRDDLADTKLIKGPAKWPYFESRDGYQLFASKLFQEGKIIVGDPASGLAPTALDPKPGSIVLDICAAPGGKSAALSMLTGEGGMVIATDNSYRRIMRLKRNFNRWKLKNVAICLADARFFPARCKFKYILLDAPCSGTGTLRRNPDLRWRLKPDDISRMADYQAELLKAAADLLAKDGRLVYSTCSIEPEENQLQIEKFMAQNADFYIETVSGIDEYRIDNGMYASFPTRHNMDGAFVAILRKSN